MINDVELNREGPIVGRFAQPEDQASVNNAIAGKPDYLPEKFWNDKSQTVRLEELVKSYVALEKRLSGSVPRPESDDDKTNLLRLLGQPETPDEYDIKVDHGMFDIDPDLNQKLHALGFTQIKCRRFMMLQRIS